MTTEDTSAADTEGQDSKGDVVGDDTTDGRADADKKADDEEKDGRALILQTIEVTRMPRERREIELPEQVAAPLRKLASDRGLAMLRARRYQLAFRLSDLRAYRQRKTDNHTHDSNNMRRAE